MFSPELKSRIADEVQKILRETEHDELPKGEIQFLLHVDGEAQWSWANITNNNPKSVDIPRRLYCNLTS